MAEGKHKSCIQQQWWRPQPNSSHERISRNSLLASTRCAAVCYLCAAVIQIVFIRSWILIPLWTQLLLTIYVALARYSQLQLCLNIAYCVTVCGKNFLWMELHGNDTANNTQEYGRHAGTFRECHTAYRTVVSRKYAHPPFSRQSCCKWLFITRKYAHPIRSNRKALE